MLCEASDATEKMLPSPLLGDKIYICTVVSGKIGPFLYSSLVNLNEARAEGAQGGKRGGGKPLVREGEGTEKRRRKKRGENRQKRGREHGKMGRGWGGRWGKVVMDRSPWKKGHMKHGI
jgi:hypothetical protein